MDSPDRKIIYDEEMADHEAFTQMLREAAKQASEEAMAQAKQYGLVVTFMEKGTIIRVQK